MSERSESADRGVLAALPAEQREKLRRKVLTSTDDDYAIARSVDCKPMHVKSMRNRLLKLGVLHRGTLPEQPRKKTAAKPTKYRNGDLFEE